MTSSNVRECPSCALEYDASDDPDVCPYCGYEFPEEKPTRMAFAMIFIALMLIWALYELVTHTI